jgi:hypothetical protein
VRPVVYHPEPLRLELWVDTIRGASFTVRYDVFDGETLAATAATNLVTFDFDTDRPRRLTAEERALLQTFTDEPAQPAAGTSPTVPAVDRPRTGTSTPLPASAVDGQPVDPAAISDRTG